MIWPKRNTLIHAGLIIVAILWVFWPALHGDWISDDLLYVSENTLMQDPARLWKAWFQPGSFVEYYPIQQTLQWFQWRAWGNDTFGYHLTNVLLHALNALLLWRLFAKLGLRLAWLGAFVFAVHPMNVESVAWIAEFKNTLSLSPFLAALCFWIEYDEHRRERDYWGALGFFLIAMLCKISMAPFPALILLYAWWRRGRIRWQDWQAILPFFVISITLGTLTILSGQWYANHIHQSTDVPVIGGVFSHLALVATSISFYLFNFLCPLNLMLSYPRWSVNPASVDQLLLAVAWFGLLGWFWIRRKTWGKHALLGIGFYLLFILPFSGVIAVTFMNSTWVMSHLAYLPMIGLIGLTLALLEQIGGRLPQVLRRPGVALVAGVIVIFAWESHTYAAAFAGPEALAIYTIQRNPTAPEPRYDLGFAMLHSGRTSEALEQFEAALQLKPDYLNARINLAADLILLGRYDEAIQQCREALRLKPDSLDACNNWGQALAQDGQMEEAARQFQAALQINPDDLKSHYDLGMANESLGRIPEAIEQYQFVLKVDPNYEEAGSRLTRLTLLGKSGPHQDP